MIFLKSIKKKKSFTRVQKYKVALFKVGTNRHLIYEQVLTKFSRLVKVKYPFLL